MPERQNFDAFRIPGDSVIEVIANAREVETTNAHERDVSGAGADFGLD
jgi:hypothetical protein